MRLFSPLFLVGLLVAFNGAWAAEEQTLEEGFVNPGFVEKPQWFKTSFLDLREDVAEAADEGKRVLLYFYQDGCPYCEKLINTNFSQRDIVSKTQKHFDVIAINIWGDKDVTDMAGNEVSEKAFARNLRVQFTPTLLFLDEQGEVALRVNGYYPPHKLMTALDYVAGRHEKTQPFRDYLASNQPAASSGKLHIEKRFLQPPYRLQRKAGDKPLLVLFEQKDCAACDELHGDTLRRPLSSRLLGQFDVAVVDLWSNGKLQTPSGETMSQSAWAKRLGVQYAPSLLFFDSSGREIFRTEAYLRPFHVQSAMEYVASGAYREQPEFQRFVQERADHMREQGIEVDLWN